MQRESAILSDTAAVEDREATGKRIEVDLLDVIAVAGGLLARKDSYLDSLDFRQQLEAAA